MRPNVLRRDRRRIATPAFNSHVEAARLAAVNDFQTALTAAEDAAGWLDAYSGATETDRREATGIIERIRLLLRSINPPNHLDGFVFEEPVWEGSDLENHGFDSAESPWTGIPEFIPPTGPALSDYDTQETPMVRIDSSTEDGYAATAAAASETFAEAGKRITDTLRRINAEPDIIVIDEDDVPEVEG